MLNAPQDEVFHKMVQSDILIFNYSSFPLYCSLYTDGLVIKPKEDKYLFSLLVHKDVVFFDNYLFISDLEDCDLERFVEDQVSK
jgi:hypothetical protein